MVMDSTITAAASFHLAFPHLSASSSSSSNTLHFPIGRRRASHPLTVDAIKKLSEASLVPIPHEPMQTLVDEDVLPTKLRVYSIYNPSRSYSSSGFCATSGSSSGPHQDMMHVARVHFKCFSCLE
ncbi:monothiol glutaredoxin-S12, chloroplastic-like, partial [Miscanthus floridulus]|uniref:monothiol glutaredoxin-S12, chloroplastic-like n=1 Tax=Miscanthus floridulus TaxID=154761 RepID=UPI0034597180